MLPLLYEGSEPILPLTILPQASLTAKAQVSLRKLPIAQARWAGHRHHTSRTFPVQTISQLLNQVLLLRTVPKYVNVGSHLPLVSLFKYCQALQLLSELFWYVAPSRELKPRLSVTFT